MREYGKIPPSFWSGSPGRALRIVADPLGRAQAQVVAAYLETTAHANMLGLYHLPLDYIAADLNITQAEARAALERLAEAGFSHYDPESAVVWVVDMAGRQVLSEKTPRLAAGDKRIKGIQRLYALLPDNPYLLPFFERYRQVFAMAAPRGGTDAQGELALDREPAAVAIVRHGPPSEAAAVHTEEGLGSPLQAPSKPGAGAGAETGEDVRTRPEPVEGKQSTGHEQAGDKPGLQPIMHKQAGKSKGVLMGQALTWFFAFWDAYDYKSGRMEAIGAWLDLERDGQITEAIVTHRILPAARAEAIRRKKVLEAKGTPKMAEGWLSGRRYEDEALIGEDPETKRRKAAATKEREQVERRQLLTNTARGCGVDPAIYEWRSGQDTMEVWETRVNDAIGEARWRRS